MTRKVSNFSDLIQRVTASCLLNPLVPVRKVVEDDSPYESEEEEEEHYDIVDDDGEDEEEEEADPSEENDDFSEEKMVGMKILKIKQMEVLMEEVFETVSSMKRAYVKLQEAHSPWDPEKMRVADVAVVSELRKLAVLRERFRRNGGGKKGGRRRGFGVASVREVVAPYEAVVEELKNEVKVKDLEVQNLKEKLEGVVALSSNGSGEKKPGRSQSKRKLGIQGTL
jgi:hypothetical protein